MKFLINAHGGGRVVSASGLETSISMSTSAIIYDAYTSIIKKKEVSNQCKEKILSVFILRKIID